LGAGVSSSPFSGNRLGKNPSLSAEVVILIQGLRESVRISQVF